MKQIYNTVTKIYAFAHIPKWPCISHRLTNCSNSNQPFSICYLVSRNRAWIRHLFFYYVLHHDTLFTLEMWTGLTTSCVKLKLIIVYNIFFREHTSRQVGWQWCKSLGCEHGYMVCILCHPLFIFTFTNCLVRFRHLKRVTSFWEKWWF